MALVPGTRLGHYEVVAPLGAEGMAEVYRARDTLLDRTVALKVLPEHLSQDPERRQRFEREARTISSLNHPNICTLHDIGQQDGVDYLVVEHLEGESLAARLEFGNARKLFRIRPTEATCNPYDVTPDGQRFLVNTLVEENPPIVLVQNCTAGMPK